MTDTTTGALLATYRHRLGLSQSGLAARWGAEIPTIKQIESGRRRADDAILRGLLLDLMPDHDTTLIVIPDGGKAR